MIIRVASAYASLKSTALFQFYYTRLHGQRMEAHGFSPSEVLELLNGKKPDSLESLTDWYREVRPQIATRLKKGAEALLGDKSPDFFESHEIVKHLAAN